MTYRLGSELGCHNCSLAIVFTCRSIYYRHGNIIRGYFPFVVYFE